MLTLERDECRVLGVLVEKAQTTPGQYPLSLNGLVTGCNQKNNRLPLVTFDEDRVLDALDGLRKKELAREVMLSGSRVTKYRHVAREALEVGTSELVILAELLLRGPQSSGELRSRATRMHPLESLEVVENVLQGLMEREPAMVRRLAPEPGGRAPRYAQLLCPDLHPLGPTEVASSATRAGGGGDGSGSSGGGTGGGAGGGELSVLVTELAARVERLEGEVSRLRASLGE